MVSVELRGQVTPEGCAAGRQRQNFVPGRSCLATTALALVGGAVPSPGRPRKEKGPGLRDPDPLEPNPPWVSVRPHPEPENNT